jgi:hypothetical protein
VRNTGQCILARVFLWCLLIPGTLLAQTGYLRQEEIVIQLDEREYRTTQPLDPSREYRVDLRSAYTFRPVLDFAHKCDTRHEAFGTTVKPVVECRTEMPFLVNGELIPTFDYFSRSGSRSADLAAYFIKNYSKAYYQPHIVLRLWGTGKPLTLKTTANFADAIPSATAAITDLVHEQAMKEKAQEEAAARAREQQRHEVLRTNVKIGSGILLVVVIAGLWYGLARRASPARDKRRVARLTRKIQDELTRMEQLRRTSNGAP